MSSLFGLLNIGAGALSAENAGVAAAGRNISNANTVGYSRETVAFESQLAAPLVGGVVAHDPTRAQDNLLSRSERDASSSGGSSGALSSALSGLETSLADSSGGVSSALATFFGSLSAVGASPADSALRGVAVSDAQALTTEFNSAANSISQAQSDSDSRIGSLATQATQLAAQIASANAAMGTSTDPVLADKRDLAAKQLTAIVGGSARVDPDGKMRVVLAGGTVLVDGSHSAQVTAVPDATLGNHLAVHVVDGTHNANVTASLDGGSIAGEISFRDGSAASAATRLDQLAYDLATKMNAVHSANAGQDGVTGRNLFTPPTAVAGAAAALSVSAAIIADPKKLAAASPGAGPGDNGGIAALTALGGQAVAAGGTATLGDEAIGIVADVGTQSAAAKNASDLASARSDSLASMRDSLSGVSTEDELNTINQLQNASQAATKFIATINTMLADLITNL